MNTKLAIFRAVISSNANMQQETEKALKYIYCKLEYLEYFPAYPRAYIENVGGMHINMIKIDVVF